MTAHHRAHARDPLRILVADDDPILRNLMRARLVRFNGQAVDAEDGLAAWTLLCSQNFDIAIVDLGMPNLDGISLIQCMRGHPRTRHLPIIVVTSQDDRASIDRAFAVGASAFLIKPVVWSTFEHHIGFLLRLVETTRDARAAGQQAVAAGRAKETILGNLCGETNAKASTIRKEIELIKSLFGSDGAAPGIAKRLDRIVGDCIAMQSLADDAATALQALSDNVIVDDRKTRLADVVASVCEAVQTHALEAGVQLTVTLPRGNTILSCDSEFDRVGADPSGAKCHRALPSRRDRVHRGQDLSGRPARPRGGGSWHRHASRVSGAPPCTPACGLRRQPGGRANRPGTSARQSYCRGPQRLIGAAVQPRTGNDRYTRRPGRSYHAHRSRGTMCIARRCIG